MQPVVEVVAGESKRGR